MRHFPVLLLSALLGSNALAIQAQAPAQDLLPRLEAWDARYLDDGRANDFGVAFVERATTVRGVTLSLNAASSSGAYQFPLTLSTNPFQRLDTPGRSGNGLTRRLAATNFLISYAPLVVQPKAKQQPGVTGTYSRVGSASFKIPLTDPDDEKIFQDSLAAVPLHDFALPGHPNLFDESRSSDLGKALDAEFQKQRNLHWKCTGKISYGLDSRKDKADSLTATFLTSKGLSSSLVFDGSIAETRFRAQGSLQSYSRTSAGVALSSPITSSVVFGIQPALDYYSGAGFKGITGLRDTTRRNDWNLAEVFTFKMPRGDSINFSIKEEHLGTRDTDVALSIGLGVTLLTPTAPFAKSGK